MRAGALFLSHSGTYCEVSIDLDVADSTLAIDVEDVWQQPRLAA
ncbi:MULTISPECIES: hypothetical protein [Bradyrhizobium]|nr:MULTISPECIES: hypothetical protein [Bradyrhizobium]